MNSEKIINILIIHNTINSQFENLALFLARNPFLRVYYLTREKTEHSFHRLHVRHYDYSEKNNYLPLEKETQEGTVSVRTQDSKTVSMTAEEFTAKITEEIKNALIKNKISNIDFSEEFLCTEKEYKEWQKSHTN